MPDQLYKRLLDFSRDGVYRYTFREGRMLFANQGFVAILDLECKPEEVVGRLMKDLLTYVEEEGSIRERIRREGEIRGFEYHFRTLKGEDKWVIHDSCAVRDEQLGEDVVEAVVKDITERKRAERALAAEHERLSVTLQSIADAVIATDTEGRIVEINAAATALTGWPAGEAEGRLLGEVFRIASEDGKLVADPAREAVATGRIVRFSARTVLAARDGAQRVVEDSVAPVRDREGRTVGAVLVFRDVSERRRQEEERERLATAVEQAGDVILITDPDGTIRYVNPAFERVCGYGRDEAIGQNPRILKSGRHERALYEELWSTITQGRLWRGHMTNRRKSGQLYEAEVAISPVRDADGRISNYVCVIQDVTREADLQRQLLQAQKLEAVGRLAGGIAHDFNNLLMVILNNADFIRDRLAPGRGGQADMDDLIEAAKRASMLTSQLLAFSRRQLLARKEVEVNEIVGSMEDMLRRVIGEDISLTVRLSSDSGFVKADRGQIEQVIMNLVVNARDAMPEGGDITIETSRSVFHSETVGHVVEAPESLAGEFACVAVSDTGCGISRDIIGKIFDPFFTTKDVGRGTGLGLCTAHGIVRQHGGYMSVYSQVGRGTTFKIYLPRVSESEAGARDSGREQPLPTGTETILLVEDDGTVRKVAARILSVLGYKVLEAENGTRAMDIAVQHEGRIDLLLTDIIMPGVDGRSVADLVGGVRPGIKVIFASGYPVAHLEEIGVLGRDMALLTKPFGRSELAKKVREVLDRA